MTRAITLETIRNAGAAVYTVARRTPLVKLAPLSPNGRGDADPATRIHLKLETLQTIGSFKSRGAANARADQRPAAGTYRPSRHPGGVAARPGRHPRHVGHR